MIFVVVNIKCLGHSMLRYNMGKNYDQTQRFLMPIVIYDIFLLYNRVLALVEKEVCSLTLDDTSRRCSIPSTYATSGRQIDKIIARGKLECSIQVPPNSSSENQIHRCLIHQSCMYLLLLQAVQAALQKLEHGDTIDDAKAVCEPEILRQLTRWNVCRFYFMYHLIIVICSLFPFLDQLYPFLKQPMHLHHSMKQHGKEQTSNMVGLTFFSCTA